MYDFYEEENDSEDNTANKRKEWNHMWLAMRRLIDPFSIPQRPKKWRNSHENVQIWQWVWLYADESALP